MATQKHASSKRPPSIEGDWVEARPFLDDIIAHPDDDARRLIFADWLDDNGQPERADLIRTQCRLARIDKEKQTATCPIGSAEQCASSDCLACPLRRRVNELLPACSLAGSTLGERLGYEPLPQDWRRGFVEVVRLPWDKWDRLDFQFRSRTPVREVRLTTTPNYTPVMDGTTHLVRVRLGRRLLSEPLDWDTQVTDGARAARIAALTKILTAHWCGITFTLPSG